MMRFLVFKLEIEKHIKPYECVNNKKKKELKKNLKEKLGEDNVSHKCKL